MFNPEIFDLITTDKPLGQWSIQLDQSEQNVTVLLSRLHFAICCGWAISPSILSIQGYSEASTLEKESKIQILLFRKFDFFKTIL